MVAIMIKNDVELFETIFMHYYPLIYRIAYRCVGQCDEAEDIAQDVFCRFYQTPPDSAEEAVQRAWLCRVAVNLGLSALRARKRRMSREDRVFALTRDRNPLESQYQNPEQSVLADEQAALIREVLAELPERQQVYLLLRTSGLSYVEIAQVTGVATSSVGTLLARAERDFRRKYHERADSTIVE
jgi:RNA polymerase sigma factor (sigma-70 family)